MKRLISILVLCAAIMSCFAIYGKKVQASEYEESISSKIIRFHILANSDSDEDQNLKLKVKDRVLKYIQPKLKESKNKAQSEEILLNEKKNIQDICLRTIHENGYDYDVSINLVNQDFPVKSYGNIVLPQGEYESYTIVIGNGQGHNWWCVMFPPLCFVDVTKGEPSYKENEKEMKGVLSDEEYDIIDAEKDDNITFGFKIFEIIKAIFE